jgi:hypothetical protein
LAYRDRYDYAVITCKYQSDWRQRTDFARKKFAGRQVLVEELESGVWLVRTATIIPDNERFPALQQAAEDRTQALDRATSSPPDDRGPSGRDPRRLYEDLRTIAKQSAAHNAGLPLMTEDDLYDDLGLPA